MVAQRRVPAGAQRSPESPESPVLRVGCPMWANPRWIGRFFPAGSRGRELAEYATWCNAVEGNTSFYAIPAPRTVERWAEQAPGEFRFAFKVPRQITHERRLRGDSVELLDRFLEAIEPLGDRVGPLQLQLPPSFGPESATTLGAFVGRLSSTHRWVVELRHPAFYDGGPSHRSIDELLHAAGVGRVILDTRPLYATPPTTDAGRDERRTKPRLAVVTDMVGPTPLVRVIGSDDVAGTVAGLRAWIPELVGWLADGREPYVFVHQPENDESPALARMLHAEVAAVVDALSPLPTPNSTSTEGTGQASLF